MTKRPITVAEIMRLAYRHISVGGPDDVHACHLPKSNAEGVLFMDKFEAALNRRLRPRKRSTQ